MLRRVRGIGLGITLWLAGLGGLGVSACGDDHGGEAGPVAAEIPSVERLADAEHWSERLAAPTVPDLLAALDQPHAVVRQHVGPHRIERTTDTTLDPRGDPPSLHPKLDAPVVFGQAVHDELELRWAEPPEPTQALLALTQTNDHDRGREVVVVGPTVHVRQAHRAWFHYPRDSDIVELWLDDAQRSVHDAVELAAPRLVLHATPIEGAGLDGGAAVDITLALAEATDPSLVAAGPTQAWRRRADIQAIEGLVRLDASSGAWLSATVDVRYQLPGADGRTLDGRLQLHAKLSVGPPGAIEAPPESRPEPQRLRYDDEQRRMLDGLAAP